MTIEARPVQGAPTFIEGAESLPSAEIIPKVSNLADFLEQAKAVVSKDWNAQMVTKLSAYPELFPDKEALFTTFEKDDFRKLESLRYMNREGLWQEILAEISKRETDTLTLAKKMIKSLTDQEIQAFKLSRQEINLYLDIARDVQPLVDSAYRQQVAIADKPGGKKEGPHAGIDGYEYLYNEKTPYINKFSDFPKLVEVLNLYAEKVKQQVTAGELTSIYDKLSDYLSLLAKNFCSPETNYEKLDKNWDQVGQEFTKLSQAGCPVVLVPWGFILDGNHIGIELMVGLNLGGDSKYYEQSSLYTSAVTEFAWNDDPSYTSIPFVHLYALTRNGDCLPWGGTACAGEFSIVMYDYENDRYARGLYEYLTRYTQTNTTLEKFIYARAINTIAHEVGHLARMLKESIYARFGKGISVGKIDEAKADLMSVIYYLKNQSSFNITPTQYLEQYLVDYIEEFVNSHGHEQEDVGVVWYSFSGKLILHELIKCGAVEEVGDKLKINSDKATDGLKGLAQLGYEIYGYYNNDKFTKTKLNKFVRDYEKKFKDNEVLQRFLKSIYRDHGILA